MDMTRSVGSVRTILGALAAVGALTVLSGCAEREADGREPDAAAAAAGTIVDSILPIEEEVRRFTEAAGPAPTSLDSEWTSVDALARDFVQALAARDTAFLTRVIVTPAEYIAFYFPHSVYMEPPYQMDPATIWFQMSSGSSRGLGRALARFGGKDLEMEGYACDVAVQQGPNLVRERCRLRLRLDGESLEIRLFGPVLERDGRVKFLTYGNDL